MGASQGLPPVPAEREETVRQAMRDELLHGPVTARDLSARVGIREKDIAAHLESIARSARARGEKLVVTPAECAKCGFRFERRSRLTRPSRCPSCGGERVHAPVFMLLPQGSSPDDDTGA